MIRLLLLLALVGCDAAHEHHAEESPLAVGCAHFMYGEDQLRTAVVSTPGPEATIAAVHQRFVIALPDTQGTEGALVAFSALTAGDYYFMLGTDLPFVLERDGVALMPSEVFTADPECPAAARVDHHTLEAGSYTLVIGPTSETSLTLVPHLAGQDHTHAE